MKKQLAISSLFLCFSALVQACENTAQTVIEIREDYKSLAELKSDLSLKAVALQGVASPAVQRKIEKDISMKSIHGEKAFNTYPKSLKGDNLYKKVLSDCIANEKRTAERRAKQDAREAANAIKEEK